MANSKIREHSLPCRDARIVRVRPVSVPPMAGESADRRRKGNQDRAVRAEPPRCLGRSASEPTRRLRAEWEQRPKAFLPKVEAPPREECCRHLEGVGKVGF